MNHLFTALILAIWVALMTISTLVFRVFGWTQLRQYPVTIAVLFLSLLGPPLGGFTYLAKPHSGRIVALLHPVTSPSISLAAGCSFFPRDNIWNTRVDDLPLDSHSGAYIESMGSATSVHPDFGSDAGYQYSIARAEETPAYISFTEAPGESDPGPYRIPDDAYRESGSDHHVLVIDPTRCRLYELFEAKKIESHEWQAGSGAIFDLRSNRLRPEGWTSADAAGLPIQAGLVRYDEALSGTISHALRFTTPHTRNTFVWPATHRASSLTNVNLPPMGQRFRLRSSFDTSGFTPEVKAIVVALKEYGMILADNGGPWFVSGAQDSRWSSGINDELRRIHGSDFEAVDSSVLMIERTSGQAHPVKVKP